MPKNISRHNEDEMWLRWLAQAPKLYDEIYYQTNPLVSYINNFGHTCLESKFGPETKFSKVLEIGAGDGQHFDFIKHKYDQYILTDYHEGHLEVARKRHGNKQNVVFEKQDALNITHEDNTFDRLISIYNLEHLPEPNVALKEWRRVVKPGGIISITLPTEGGLAWNTGRYLTTRRYFKKHGLDLNYIIAREHINACYRLVHLIRYYFPRRKEVWFPFRIPTVHINLVYSCTIFNQ